MKSDRLKVIDFFKHNSLDISPIACRERRGFVMNYGDFVRSIELGKRQKRKRCVGTQVSEKDLPGPENFDHLFE